MESLDLSPYATTSDLQSALQQQSEASESALKQSSEELGGRMEGVETDLARLTEQIDELQVRLTPTLSGTCYSMYMYCRAGIIARVCLCLLLCILGFDV